MKNPSPGTLSKQHSSKYSNCNSKSEKVEILLEACVAWELSSIVLYMKWSFRLKGPVTPQLPILLPLFEFIIYLEQSLDRFFYIIMAR